MTLWFDLKWLKIWDFRGICSMMTIEEIQSEIGHLSDEHLSKVIAYAVHLKNLRDPESAAILKERLDDKDPEHWLTIEEFEARLEDS